MEFQIALVGKSSIEEQFKTCIAVAEKPKTLRTLSEDLGVEDDATEEKEIKEILPFPNMEASILDKIIDWRTYHLSEEEPDLDKPHPDAKDGATRIMRKLKTVEKKWCAGVPEIQDDGFWAMLDLLQAANYLHTPGLIKLISKEVAKRIHNEKNETWAEIKTPEEIRQVFHIVNDLDDEDEEKDGSNESKKKKTEEK